MGQRRPGRARAASHEFFLLLLALLLLLAPSANASFIDRLVKLGGGSGEIAGSGAAKSDRRMSAGLDAAIAALKRLPPDRHATTLVAGMTPEGHWRLANVKGEVITSADGAELKRSLSVLLGDAANAPNARLGYLVTEDVAFLHAARLKELPAAVVHHVVVAGESYRLLTRAERTDRSGNGAGDRSVPRLFAEVRPDILVELVERPSFDEAMAQLARPLRRDEIRVIALEPGAPRGLPRRPKLDPATKQPLIDRIEPLALADAIRGLRNRTVVVTGRIDGELLVYKPGTGIPDQSLLVRDLMQAAEAADVNLILLQATRQPGNRTWLLLRTEVKGLDKALGRATLGDFYETLASSHGRLAVTARAEGRARVALEAVPFERVAGGAPLARPGAFLDRVVTHMTGFIAPDAIRASFVSAERQGELDRRLMPWVPSWLQLGYLGLVALGVVGLPAALRWWRRIWPAERREEYAGRSGYLAAVGVRGLLFALLFVPVVALPSAVATVLGGLFRLITLPTRQRRKGPPPAGAPAASS